MTADPEEKFLDLDAALDEETAAEKPLEVTLFGKVWELPGTPPAALTIRVARWAADGLVDDEGQPVEGGGLTDAHIALLAVDVVPPNVLQAWFDHGLATDKLVEILPKILAKYDGVSKRLNRAQRRAEGKPRKAAKAAKAAKRSASKTSSKAGRSSKPTSSASTASTSPPA